MASAQCKPTVLLPLRLEIRHLQNSIEENSIHLARYEYADEFDIYGNLESKGHRLKGSRKFVFEPQKEVWIRWYPDDCQVFPRISKIGNNERESYNSYKNEVEEIKGNDELADDERQNGINAAWKEFVDQVGLQRARFLMNFNGEDPAFDDEYHEEALDQFLEKGEKLKALPNKVKLYTIHEDVNTLEREIKFLAEGNAIPSDIVFSASDIPSARWIVDFEEAVANGMGIKIIDPIKCEQVESADWLIAVGHKKDNDCIFEELIKRYKALDRLGVPRQDSATNNIETHKADFVSNEEGTKRENIISDHIPNTPMNHYLNNGDMISIGLGVKKDVFRGVDNASLIELEAARSMNQLLWPACTKAYSIYFKKFDTTSEQITPIGDYSEWPFLSEHFINYVFGRGHAVRIGNCPYGILPIVNSDKWESASSDPELYKFESNLVKICQLFKKKYLKLAESSPRIDLASDDDVFETLVQILQHNAVSHRVDIQVFEDNDRTKPDKGFGKDPSRLTCPLVAKDGTKEEQLSEVLGYFQLVKDYLDDNLGSVTWVVPTMEEPESSLFQRLLQYSATLAKGDTESESKLKEALEVLKELLEGEIITIQDAQILIMEVLDCLSYRLDALFSSLALSHLDKIRTCWEEVKSAPNSDTEQRIKGFQYHEDSKKISFKGIMTEEERDAIKELFNDTEFEDDDKTSIEKLYQATQENISNIGVYGFLEKPSAQGMSNRPEGYFRALSMNQGITTAILASAAFSERNNEKRPFHINLSSERVKKALWFIQTLQKGYTSPEVLGTYAERLLHDRGMDKYLLDLRKQYPLSDQDENALYKNSRVIDGEKFLSGNRDSYIISQEDQETINDIRSEVRQVLDSVSDLYIAETLYWAVQDNSPQVKAWLDVNEGKNIPYAPEFIKTPSTGTPQTQKVLYPLNIDWDDIDLDEMENPCSIAEPAIAQFCSSELADFEKAVLKITVTSRDTNNEGQCTVEISPYNDLDLEPFDLVIGERSELEKRARIYLWEKLLEERDDWRIDKSRFGDNSLVDNLIDSKIISTDKENTDYVYFSDKINTEAQLTQELINAGIDNTDLIITIWRETQKWKFLGRDFLSSPTMAELNNRALLSFDYSYSEGDKLALSPFIKKSQELHSFLKDIQPLKPEDIVIPEDMDINEVVEQKKNGYLLLKERIIRILEVIELDKSKLKVLRDALENLPYNGTNNAEIETKVKEIQALILKISKYSLPEALIPLPLINSHEIKKVVIAKVDSILDKIKKCKKELEESFESITLIIEGSEITIKISDEKKFINKVTGEEIGNIGVKLAAIEKLIRNTISLLRKCTQGEAMPIFPPFVLNQKFHITESEGPDNGVSYEKSALEEKFADYRRVRKKVEKLLRIVPSNGSLKVFSENVFQNSREEAVMQGLRKLQSEGVAEPLPEDILFPQWRQSGLNLHFVLPEQGVNIEPDKPLVGFTVDEWTDFIPDLERTTACVFQKETPQAESPKAILLPVPPNINSYTWTDDKLAEIIAETIDLMRIRSVSSEAIVGSNLGNLLPGLLFDNTPNEFGDFICRFPHTQLELFNGVIAGGFYYTSSSSVNVYSGPSARRDEP